MKKLLLAVIFIAGLAPVVAAKSIYVAQNSAGGNNGSDCADAHAVSFVNLASNYGSGAGQINPGDVVHLCGTFTGTPGGNMISIAGSGTSGHPITFQSDAGSPANFTAPYWSGTNGAIFCQGQQYITLDGNNNGVIQDTANGTTSAYQQTYFGIYNYCPNTTIENWTVGPLYVRTQGSDTDNTDGTCITTRDASNVLITNNTVNYCRVGIADVASVGATSTEEISFNTISFVDHGITIASNSPGVTQSGALIHDNDIGGGGYMWDGTTTCNWHHDGIHTFFEGTNNALAGEQIYNNYIHGLWGEANVGVGGCLNSLMFFEAGIISPAVFNNVLELDSGTHNVAASGFIGFEADALGSGAIVVNNTLVNNMTGVYMLQFVGEPNVTVENNIVIGNGFGVKYDYYSSTPTSGTIDHNLYYGAASNLFYWMGNYDTFANWQAIPLDTYGFNGQNPNLSNAPSFRLPAISPAANNGANLTSLGITALNIDKAGTARPSSGVWSIGAFQAPLTPMNPPTSVTGTSH